MSYWAPGGARRTARVRPIAPHLGILGFSEPDGTGLAAPRTPPSQAASPVFPRGRRAGQGGMVSRGGPRVRSDKEDDV